MDNQDVADELKTLDQYEIDGALLVDQAIHKLNDEEIKNQLMTFKAECDDNIKKLGECIKDLGEEPPAYTSDLKGYIMKAYEAIRGMGSDKGVMQALDTNTKPLIRYYEKVLSLEFPMYINDLLKELSNTAKKHADYIAQQAQAL